MMIRLNRWLQMFSAGLWGSPCRIFLCSGSRAGIRMMSLQTLQMKSMADPLISSSSTIYFSPHSSQNITIERFFPFHRCLSTVPQDANFFFERIDLNLINSLNSFHREPDGLLDRHRFHGGDKLALDRGRHHRTIPFGGPSFKF